MHVDAGVGSLHCQTYGPICLQQSVWRQWQVAERLQDHCAQQRFHGCSLRFTAWYEEICTEGHQAGQTKRERKMQRPARTEVVKGFKWPFRDNVYEQRPPDRNRALSLILATKRTKWNTHTTLRVVQPRTSHYLEACVQNGEAVHARYEELPLLNLEYQEVLSNGNKSLPVCFHSCSVNWPALRAAGYST